MPSRFVLAALFVVVCADVARADLSPPPPMHVHVGRVISVVTETTADATETRRVVVAVRTVLHVEANAIQRCADCAHVFSWRDWDAQRARIRFAWNAGATTPAESTIVSSTFPDAATACIQTAMSHVVVDPAPSARVVLLADVVRDDAY